MTATTIHTHNTAKVALFLAPQDNQGAGVQKTNKPPRFYRPIAAFFAV